MRLIDADELKECFRWSEVCRLSISEINKIIDNAPTIPLPDFKEGYKQAIIDGKTNFSNRKVSGADMRKGGADNG